LQVKRTVFFLSLRRDVIKLSNWIFPKKKSKNFSNGRVFDFTLKKIFAEKFIRWLTWEWWCMKLSEIQKLSFENGFGMRERFFWKFQQPNLEKKIVVKRSKKSWHINELTRTSLPTNFSQRFPDHLTWRKFFLRKNSNFNFLQLKRLFFRNLRKLIFFAKKQGSPKRLFYLILSDFVGFFGKLIRHIRRIWPFSWKKREKLWFFSKNFVQEFCWEFLREKFRTKIFFDQTFFFWFQRFLGNIFYDFDLIILWFNGLLNCNGKNSWVDVKGLWVFLFKL